MDDSRATHFLRGYVPYRGVFNGDDSDVVGPLLGLRMDDSRATHFLRGCVQCRGVFNAVNLGDFELASSAPDKFLIQTSSSVLDEFSSNQLRPAALTTIHGIFSLRQLPAVNFFNQHQHPQHPQLQTSSSTNSPRPTSSTTFVRSLGLFAQPNTPQSLVRENLHQLLLNNQPTLTFIKVASPAQPENTTQAQGIDNPITIDLPYPAVRLDIAQSFAYIPNTRIWAGFLCASFYDADDNELWHTEILIGSFPQLAHHREALEFFGPDPESNSFSPLDSRTHNNSRIHQGNFIPENRTIADPNNENNTITIPHFPQRNIINNMSGGWNPRSGYDAGDANGGPPLGGPAGFTAIPAVSAPGYPVSASAVPVPPFAQQSPVYTMSPNGFQQLAPGIIPQQQTSNVLTTQDTAGNNFQNSTGGVGCEPGYNYYFPAQHTKIHVIKSRDPPWRLAPGMSMWFGAYHVPCNITLGDIMKGFGATNADSKKNRITEVNPGGGGKWYKGITWAGDDKDKMKLTLKEVGWDHTRVGSEKPVVWVWITNT